MTRPLQSLALGLLLALAALTVHFLPRDDRELRAFVGLSATAGIVEEIIYRGFLIWCLALLMPLLVLRHPATGGLGNGGG